MNTSDASTGIRPAVEPKLQVFLARDARHVMAEGCMTVEFPKEILPLLGKAVANGLQYGDDVRVLYNVPGFSLTYAWIKKDYPLSVHTHNTDCLYLIMSGSLHLGNQKLGKGDGFFVPADVPYSYVAGGDNGIEVLEFRHETSFNFKSRSKEAFWIKAAETCAANAESWKSARSPLTVDAPDAAAKPAEDAQPAAVADRFWAALDSGNVDEAMACCAPSFTAWHSFDQKTQLRAEAEAGFRGFVGHFAERATSQIRRNHVPGGIFQQHVLTVRQKPDVPRRAWAICVLMRFSDGKLSAIEEYMDRGGSYDPEAVTVSAAWNGAPA